MSRFDYTPSESLAPLWAWLGLIVVVNAYWLVFDLVLAPRYRWEMMTVEFREGLDNPILGPFVFGGMFFTVGAFVWHMLNLHTSK